MDGTADTPAPEAQFAPPQFHSGDHFPPPVSVVLHDEPKPRRTGLFAAVGLLLVAAVAGGAFLLMRGDDAKDTTYSLEAATSGLDETEGLLYSVVVDSMGEEVTIDAEYDGTTGNTRITMQADGMFDDGIEMIVSESTKTIYVSSDLFGVLGLDIETEWIKMDEEFLAEQGDNSFESAANNDVLNAGSLLEDAKSVEEIGLETIDGEELMHYRVTVDKETALTNSPELETQIDELGGEMPDDVVYDMWVTEDNQLRRMSVDLDIGSSILKTLFVVKTPEGPISVELPDDDDTTSADELL
jgi:hypothetical protein